MNQEDVITFIGKAIREGKYLNITYKNKSGEINPFWISILDINSNDELYVNMFNITKDEPILNSKIFISSIINVEILKFSHYEAPEALMKKIDTDASLQKYCFDKFDNNILNYYLECYKANHDPFLHKSHLIQSIDLDTFIDENWKFQCN